MGREEILNSVRKNKPELLPLPEINVDLFNEDIDLLSGFKEKVALVGGTIKQLTSSKDIDNEIMMMYPNATNIVNRTQVSSLGTVSISEKTQPKDLEDVDLAILRGTFGVAENGAIWISEEQLYIRALPFITNDLLIILGKKDICQNLHKAYELISKRKRTFGLFISGPSKTADIEQCLVIGAQGALSLTVLLI
ncbi:LUD domain-containing protein [Maribacter sp. TH_r10]|uniref:LutC/YkgG family protein n=1 Tax=Maribacter sp. TH_r10 TaxID=3082086 RepID=UPI00295347D8|nr:LUD domain-containing protein [Maribacter sp. TH_r10]MDV7139172.1 LUD domain-containing protein [Maribacter sp. TH_r10]